MWEPQFRPQERLEDLELERRTMEFLFSEGDTCTFMNPSSFEQIEIPTAGRQRNFFNLGSRCRWSSLEKSLSASSFLPWLKLAYSGQRRRRTFSRTVPGSRPRWRTVSPFRFRYSLRPAKWCGLT